MEKNLDFVILENEFTQDEDFGYDENLSKIAAELSSMVYNVKGTYPEIFERSIKLKSLEE